MFSTFLRLFMICFLILLVDRIGWTTTVYKLEDCRWSPQGLHTLVINAADDIDGTKIFKIALAQLVCLLFHFGVSSVLQYYCLHHQQENFSPVFVSIDSSMFSLILLPSSASTEAENMKETLCHYSAALHLYLLVVVSSWLTAHYCSMPGLKEHSRHPCFLLYILINSLLSPAVLTNNNVTLLYGLNNID